MMPRAYHLMRNLLNIHDWYELMAFMQSPSFAIIGPISLLFYRDYLIQRIYYLVKYIHHVNYVPEIASNKTF